MKKKRKRSEDFGKEGGGSYWEKQKENFWYLKFKRFLGTWNSILKGGVEILTQACLRIQGEGLHFTGKYPNKFIWF